MNSFDVEAGQYVVDADESRRHHHYVPGETRLGKDYRRLLVDELSIPAGDCLDIGGGTGEVASLIEASSPTAVYVSDLYSQAFSLDATQGRSVQARAVEQPFPAGQFQCVHLKDVLVHIELQLLCFEEIQRLLSVGGRAIIATQCMPFNACVLYYAYGDFEMEKTLSIGFGTSHEYQTIRTSLSNGVNDSTIFGDEIIAAKKRENIAINAQPISMSPPYYQVMLQRVIDMAEIVGLAHLTTHWLQSSEDEEDWYDMVERMVLEFEKV